MTDTMNSIQRKGKNRIFDCELHVRQDMTVAYASEGYYQFVDTKSMLPVTDFLGREATELLKGINGLLKEPIECITTIDNLNGRIHHIYMRAENSARIESEGEHLYRLIMYDYKQLKARNDKAEEWLIKYRNFLSWSKLFFFEYNIASNNFIVYRYANEQAAKLVDVDLDEFFMNRKESLKRDLSEIEQMNRFVTYLKEGSMSFEMEFTRPQGEKEVACKVFGAQMRNDRNFMIGVFQPVNQSEEEEQEYFMKTSSKDAATGLLNKSAAAEFSLEQLRKKDGKVRWIVMMDIDDFKFINDTYGHLFGDEVISRMAAIAKKTLGRRGIVGRFGGDEFYLFIDGIEDREELRNFLKTMVRSFYYEFSPNLKVTASIGVSKYPDDGTDYEVLMSKADKALYIAKEKGKNRHIIYDEQLHGSYEQSDKHLNAVKYTISKEKKTKALSELFCGLTVSGIEHLKNNEVLTTICQVLDIDAISVCSDFGTRYICGTEGHLLGKNGVHNLLQNEKYLRMFGKDGVYIENKAAKLISVLPDIYVEFKKSDIGATIQCIGKVDGRPHSWVSFDVLGTSRKWNDADVELFTIVGKCICNLLDRKA
ncbi:MAG: GGDEF domain-containing protein [Lachnospiraceae bacterium]|nr:GGDEF domain-containing protein [Lachnospiraceae bacterium]